MLDEKAKSELIEDFVAHEVDSARRRLRNPFDQLLWADGVLRNGLSKLIGPDTEFHPVKFGWDQLEFASTNSRWNEVLLGRCQRSPLLFRALLDAEPEILSVFTGEISYGLEPIFTVPRRNGMFRAVDGMHRIVGAVAEGRNGIDGYAIINPVPVELRAQVHVIDDLLTAFHHNPHPQSADHLFGGLYSLANTFPNLGLHLQQRVESYDQEDPLHSVILKVLFELGLER